MKHLSLIITESFSLISLFKAQWPTPYFAWIIQQSHDAPLVSAPSESPQMISSLCHPLFDSSLTHSLPGCLQSTGSHVIIMLNFEIFCCEIFVVWIINLVLSALRTYKLKTLSSFVSMNGSILPVVAKPLPIMNCRPAVANGQRTTVFTLSDFGSRGWSCRFAKNECT